MKQFHKIKFGFNSEELPKTLSVYHNIEVVCAQNELYASNGGGGFSLYLGESYLCLDCDTESKRIGNFGGIINRNNIKFQSVQIPQNITDGILYFSGEPCFRGGALRFEFAGALVYDSEKCLLQIGRRSNLPCLRFLKNAYCQLADGNLQCLLIEVNIQK